MTKYLVPIFGNVKTSFGLFHEGSINAITDAQAASTEVTGLASLGYLSTYATLILAQGCTFTPLATRIAAGERAVTKPLIYSPAVLATKNSTNSTVIGAEATAAGNLATAANAKIAADAALAAVYATTEPV
jgi:hypothetical protein